MFTADTEAQNPLNRRTNVTPGRSFLENSFESFELPTVSTDNFFISEFFKKSLSPNSVEKIGLGSPESQSYCYYSPCWVIIDVPPKGLGRCELCLRRTKKNGEKTLNFFREEAGNLYGLIIYKRSQADVDVVGL